MNLSKMKLSITGIFLFVFLINISHMIGQERTKSAHIIRTESPPKIDGLIEDDCWKNKEPLSGFFQFDPVNGVKASEETLVWMVYDQRNIYFAFLMQDSKPNKIWAELTPRNTYENNDSITVILDTYNDKRTSIEFTVNPKGVQKNSVETIWKSGAAVRHDGWSAEMAIPFKSLRFSSEEVQVWGINFERYIHRLNEQDYWTDVDRDIPRLHQMGELIGLSGVKPGYNIEFFPYAGYRTSRWNGEKDDKLAAGLDFKYGILPNLILDLTASPDFSEVESDPFIFQRTPYENYFRENRPFFSEGSQYFRLSTERRHGWRRSLSLFYSRRISDPKIAGKISGKTGGYSFGILGALNKEEEGDAFYSVVRVQKDIFKNSQVGIYYAGMSAEADYNRNLALDYNFNFGRIYFLRGMHAFSFNHGAPKEDQGMHIVQFERDIDAGIQLEMNFQRIEENVDVRTGFVNQVDQQTFELSTGYAWRFNQGQLRRVSLDLGGNLNQDTHGNLTGNSVDFRYWTEFLAKYSIHGGFSLGKSKYQVFDETDSLIWTDDFIQTYGGDIDFRWDRGGFIKEVSIEAGWEKRGIYNDDFSDVERGSHISAEFELTLRPLSYLEWSFSSDWIKQKIDRTGETVFDGMTYATALHLQLTRNFFLNTRLFGETRDNQYNFDFLVGYYFGAGNVIQLSYKKGSKTENFLTEKGYSITLKVSYLLRI
ncbi:MAG: carbohydrate binding family 9 domain-containing protein [Candidatus Aminicenantes bacterium]|nr:MAG: carbohydrate binding family 9 domain-containing protein [Candidatus Aminicenantes bacterium]